VLRLLLAPRLSSRARAPAPSNSCASRSLCFSSCAPRVLSGTTRQNDPCSSVSPSRDSDLTGADGAAPFLLWSSCSSRDRGLLLSKPCCASRALNASKLRQPSTGCSKAVSRWCVFSASPRCGTRRQRVSGCISRVQRCSYLSPAHALRLNRALAPAEHSMLPGCASARCHCSLFKLPAP
jgi:hypothetical protein